jgi:predicted lactoylglutathione lyase
MMAPNPALGPDAATMIRALIPMAHVADVEASIRFYELLGFTVKDRFTHAAITNWASLASGVTMLMLTRASGPIDAEQQAVLFYLYCDDVKALRTRLLSLGVTNAGPFTGTPLHATSNNGRSVLYEITHPHYMPAGELRVHDPDGYVLLIGQLR